MSIYFFACSQFVLEVQTCGHSKHCLYHLRRDNVCRRLPRWLLGHAWECCSHNGDLLNRIDEVNLLVHKQKCITSRHLQTVIYTYTYIYIIYIYTLYTEFVKVYHSIGAWTLCDARSFGKGEKERCRPWFILIHTVGVAEKNAPKTILVGLLGSKQLEKLISCRLSFAWLWRY